MGETNKLLTNLRKAMENFESDELMENLQHKNEF